MAPGLQAMDVDNGDGNILKVLIDEKNISILMMFLLQNLPCTMRLNQLVCTGPGESYPRGSITTFVGDNKVSVITSSL